MNCIQCKKKSSSDYGFILISQDGDFVCSEKCKEQYDKEMKYFLDVTINDDELFEQWLLNKDV